MQTISGFISIQQVSKKEGLNLLPELADRIALKSDRNLRRAILMLETCKVQQYPFTPDREVLEPDWLMFLRDTCKQILSEQSPKKLIDIRNRFYEILVHGIPTDVIFKVMLNELVKSCDSNLKAKVVDLAALYEYQMHQGSKVIFHIEAFVANFMSLYLNYLEESVMME